MMDAQSSADLRDGWLVVLTEVVKSYCYDHNRAAELARQIQDEFIAVAVTEQTAKDLVARVRELTRNPFPRGSYEVGYSNGESKCEADWTFALTEFCDLPADVEPWDPAHVAHYIDQLQKELASGRPTGS